MQMPNGPPDDCKDLARLLDACQADSDSDSGVEYTGCWMLNAGADADALLLPLLQLLLRRLCLLKRLSRSFVPFSMLHVQVWMAGRAGPGWSLPGVPLLSPLARVGLDFIFLAFGFLFSVPA